MQSSKSNNVMFGIMAGLLLTILLIGLSVLNSRLMERKALSSKYDYYIVEGVDYANGKLLKTKVLKDKTIVWTKYEKNECSLHYLQNTISTTTSRSLIIYHHAAAII